MLQWTLRAIAALAIVAAIATPVAVPAPEAVVAVPAVATPASAPDTPRAWLTSTTRGMAHADHPVALSEVRGAWALLAGSPRASTSRPGGGS
ncbi:hypothetical protein ACFXOM_14330 [Streptomyces sp. NPDC059169]|uniref:hypothetical protein n=1 Tax=Streptomyces sp. NPDC059169 TaxID=3346754 RepID=UPI00367E7A98